MPSRAAAPGYDERAARGYAERRRPDPRIEAAIAAALGDAASVVNVGAGAGSYEPRDRRVVAVEPSLHMLAQRQRSVASKGLPRLREADGGRAGERRSRAPEEPLALLQERQPLESSGTLVRAAAEALPFADASFDAALAVLTIHHWEWRRGIAELRRVAPRVVVLTFETEMPRPFWLFDYFPGILEGDRARMPPIEELCAALDGRATPLPIPHDCTDGFLGAFWRSPSAYLDERVRAPISGFVLLSEEERARGLDRLADDLDSGAWEAAHGALLTQDTLDIGYRLIASASVPLDERPARP